MFGALIKYIADLTKTGPLEAWEQPYFIHRFYTELFNLKETCYYFKGDGTVAKKQFTQATEPFRMVSKANRDGMMETAGYAQRLHEFKTYEIYSSTGMSFIEWLQLPPHLIEAFLMIYRTERREIESIKAKERSKLERSTNASAEEQQMAQLLRSSKALR